MVGNAATCVIITRLHITKDAKEYTEKINIE